MFVQVVQVRLFRVDDYFAFFVCDFVVVGCKIQGSSQEIDGNRWIKINHVKSNKGVFALIRDIILNQDKTALVFFHWFTPIASITLVFIRSSICLLIFLISDLHGLMRRHVGLFWPFGLWSFSVIKGSVLAVVLTLSATCKRSAIFFDVVSIDFTV